MIAGKKESNERIDVNCGILKSAPKTEGEFKIVREQ